MWLTELRHFVESSVSTMWLTELSHFVESSFSIMWLTELPVSHFVESSVSIMWLTELSYFVESSAYMVNVLKDMENQKPAPSRSSPSSGSMDIVSLRKKAHPWLAYLRCLTLIYCDLFCKLCTLLYVGLSLSIISGMVSHHCFTD